jgi:uncharacterized repeat protein (TIGR04138 family)
MHEISFEDAVDFIHQTDPRYSREAYFFVREALDHTQELITKEGRNRVRHVTGQELLNGIRDLALRKYGPMASMVFQEWGVHACEDFGELVFNMVECGGSPVLGAEDIRDGKGLASRLKDQADPVSRILWERLSGPAREKIKSGNVSEPLEQTLAEAINDDVIANGCLYDAQVFAGVKLSELTKNLLARELAATHHARLNRLLLEDAFPHEIAKAHGLLAKTDQDSRADFQGGYDFYEAFRKPFLPPSKQAQTSQGAPASASGL